MSDRAECQIIGRWRILEADQWDRDPAFIAFDTMVRANWSSAS
jgi:hypothetical protein